MLILDKKKDPSFFRATFLGGEGEIRTRGELPHDGFQDRYLKPLGHLSVHQDIIAGFCLIFYRLSRNH